RSPTTRQPILACSPVTRPRIIPTAPSRRSARVLQADQKNSVLSHRGGTKKSSHVVTGVSPVQLISRLYGRQHSHPPRRGKPQPPPHARRRDCRRTVRRESTRKSLRCPA